MGNANTPIAATQFECWECACECTIMLVNVCYMYTIMKCYQKLASVKKKINTSKAAQQSPRARLYRNTETACS